ncbi:MAG: hypothetical protein DRQ57_15960 [Gammaproteobacteria bacterium]|nr:MAG: hypothetical protein DRQ57_15960 [Gammaproteobacteria bacterium]
MDNNFWPKRLFTLDVSRSFAALAVVLSHWHNFSLDEGFDRTTLPLYSILKIFYENGFMAVAYFFLVSGFIFFWLYKCPINNKELNFGKFWIQRISRLYPLHLITLLIVALLQTIYSLYNGNSFNGGVNDIYHFFLHLGFASNWGFETTFSFNTPVWSVSIEILVYFIFFIIVYNKIGGALFCLSTSIISITLIPFANHYHHVLLLKGVGAFFLGGFIFHLTFLISTKLQSLKLPIYGVTILLWFLTIIHFYIFNFSDFILKFGMIGTMFIHGFPYVILFPFTVLALAIVGIDKVQFLKSISWVGDITYSTYLLHFPLQIIFALFVSYGILSQNFYLNPVYLVIFFFILISLSYFTFIGFERPVQNIIRSKYKTACTIKGAN